MPLIFLNNKQMRKLKGNGIQCSASEFTDCKRNYKHEDHYKEWVERVTSYKTIEREFNKMKAKQPITDIKVVAKTNIDMEAMRAKRRAETIAPDETEDDTPEL